MEQFYKKARVPLRMASSTGSQAVMCKGCEITNSDVELSSNMFGILDNTGDVKISDTHSEIGGDFSGIYSYGKVSITNGDTYIDAGTYGICADDSIIVDWTTDKETRIYSKNYTCPSGKLVFSNCFGLLQNSAVATAQNADNQILCAAYLLHITSANAATYYEGHYDVQMSRALVASIVTIQIENNDTTLNFVPIAGGTYHYDILSSNTPVMITRNPDFANDTTSTYAMIYYNYNEQLWNVYPYNILKGSDVDTLTYGGDKYFRLMPVSGDIGWYPSNSNYSPFPSSAHRAWLPLTNEQVNTIDPESFILTTELYAKKTSVLFEGEEEEDATGIDNVIGDFNSDVDVWYDLNGRMLQGRPGHRGVYINQGKKVIVW